jgi:hypothetical protein
MIMVQIDYEEDEDEDVPGLHKGLLAAFRPQLVGAIAEDADRVLAQGEEARALLEVAGAT